MRKKILALAALPLVLAFLGGCGSSGHHNPPPSDNVPVVVSISDTTPAIGEALPTGVNLVSTQVTVTGACLLTASDTGVAACPAGQSLIPAGADVQFSSLPTPSQPDVLSNTAVTANTYTGIMVTFSSPLAATVSVDPLDSFSDGTTTCDNTAGGTLLFCPLAPVASATSVTLTFPTAITLTAGTPVSIVLGLDVTGSFAASASAPPVLSVNPVVTVTQGAVGSDGNLIDIANVTGTVGSIGGGTITLTDSITGLPLTLNTGSATVTNYPMNTTTCTTANTLACVQAGDVVTIGYGASNTNPIQFTATTINGNPGITSTNGFQGTIIVAGEGPEVVVTAVPAGNTLSGLAVGQVYDLSFTDGAVFSNSTGATLPVGSFASAADLVVGQNVLVDVACTTNAGVTTCDLTPPAAVVAPAPQGAGSVTADAIELLPSTIPGVLNTATTPNYTVFGLSSFYTNNGVTALFGTTTGSTTYSGTLTSFAGLTADETYYYTGYLLNSGTVADPDLFTTSIFGGPTSEESAVKAKNR